MLRLASILWRRRRATTMETGLFEIQAKYIRDYRQGGQVLSDSREVIEKLFEPAVSVGAHEAPHSEAVPGFAMKSDNHAVQLAQCFLRLSNLQNFALDRLSRYEATLWRQAGQILYALEMLDRRKPQERRAHFWFSREKPIE